MNRFLVICAVGLVACSTKSAAPIDDAGSTADAAVDDPDPALSEADWAALRTLAPAELPAPPPDPTNSFADDPRAIALGKLLFFDASFSGVLLDGDNDGSPSTLGHRGESGRVSCGGCHVPTAGFADDRSLHRQLSLASRWSHRRTPSLLDVGQAKLLMWDGRKDSLFSQVFGPIEANEEMNSSRLFVAERIFTAHRVDYEAIFGAMPPLDQATRFPPLTGDTTGCRRVVTDAGTDSYQECHGVPGDGAEYDGMTSMDRDAVTRVVVNAGKAIGAYERTLRCGPSRFDAWVHGDAGKLTRAEQRGAQLFVSRARCVECHTGPFMSDQRFHQVGLRPVALDPTFLRFLVLDDPGASKGFATLLADPLNSTGSYSDGNDGRVPTTPGVLGGIRTPTLRCVSTRPSFMRTGQMHTLDEVVAFFDRGGDPFGYVGKNELVPLGLSARERADVVAFMHALDP